MNQVFNNNVGVNNMNIQING